MPSFLAQNLTLSSWALRRRGVLYGVLAVLFLIAPSAFADPCWCAFESPPGFHNHQLPGILLNGTRFSRSPIGMEMFRPNVGEELAYNCPEFLNPFLHLVASKFSVDGSALSTSYCNGGLICQSPDLVDGAHSVLYQCNLSDGQSSTKGLSLTVDDTAPLAVISTPSAGAALRGGTHTISGLANDGFGIGPERVTIYWAISPDTAPPLSVIGAGGPGPVALFSLGQSSWPWAINQEFDHGTNHVLLWTHAADHLGNGSSVADMKNSAVSFIIDGEGPRLAITSHRSGVSHLTAISGTAEDKITLQEVRLEIRHNLTGKYWNGDSFVVSGSSPPFVLAGGVSGPSSAWYYNGFSPQVLVVDSSYTIAAQAMDSVGNFSAVEYSTFTYGVVPRVRIAALKGRMGLPEVVSSTNSFELSWGGSAVLCAQVLVSSGPEIPLPENIESRIVFKSKSGALEVTKNAPRSADCPGITVRVKAKTAVCLESDVVEAFVDDFQPTRNGKTAAKIITPRFEFAVRKEKDVQCTLEEGGGMNVTCRGDFYNLLLEPHEIEDTPKLILPIAADDPSSIEAQEQFSNLRNADYRVLCSTKLPEAFSGPVGFDNLRGLYFVGDFQSVGPVRMEAYEAISGCAHKFDQKIFIRRKKAVRGGCQVSPRPSPRNTSVTVTKEAERLIRSVKTERTDCRKPDCAP